MKILCIFLTEGCHVLRCPSQVRYHLKTAMSL